MNSLKTLMNSMIGKGLSIMLLPVICLVLANAMTVKSQEDTSIRRDLLGGQNTVFNDTPNAFSQPAPGMERQQELFFFVGNSFFNQHWVATPASTKARDGLGPFFDASSCDGCHFKDGRGRAPETVGARPTGLVIRISLSERDLHGDYLPDPTYGTQLQDSAVEGLQPEVEILLEYTELSGTYADGSSYTLLKPNYQLTNFAYGDPNPELLVSPRVASQMIGLGLLEDIPETALLALADPNDQNKDGISGRPNYVWDRLNSRMTIGRIGWKAQNPSVFDQVVEAFNGDVGVTTGLMSGSNCMPLETACLNSPNGGDPEISDDDLLKVVLYSRSLAVPAQRNPDDPQVQFGAKLFEQAQCQLCHTIDMQTGIDLTIPILSNQSIHPYTDLLLHDMGDELGDGRPDFEASGNEWRTPPLWGIGLFKTVNGHTRYLHDGRARNLEEAILWHGGEAAATRDAFKAMSANERNALITFLESL